MFKIRILVGYISLLLIGSSTLCAQYVTQASAGSIVINGDIEPVRDALNYFSFGVSREYRNNVFLEVKAGFGIAYGLNPELARTSAEGGYLVEETYGILGARAWYPTYRNSHLMLDFGLNYRPDIGIEWIRVIGGAGLGLAKSSRSLNLFGPDNKFYNRDFSNINTAERISSIKDYYDVSYETEFNEGSDITPHVSLQLGIQIRLNENLFLYFEARHHATASDYLDVVKFRDATQETGDYDSVTMISAGFSGYISQNDKNRSADH